MSRNISMNKYQIKFYKGNYRQRQKQANREHCILYVEQHFNASRNNPDAKYAMVIVGHNASKTSLLIAKRYLEILENKLGIVAWVGGARGVKKSKLGKRGDVNLRYTNMPAVLLEPLFCSNFRHAKIIKNPEGQLALAQVLVDTIKKVYPDGGLIGFSVGHKYKSSRPNDRGAIVYGGGNEADYAEIVLKKAKMLIEENQDQKILTLEDMYQKSQDVMFFFKKQIKKIKNEKYTR